MGRNAQAKAKAIFVVKAESFKSCVGLAVVSSAGLAWLASAFSDQAFCLEVAPVLPRQIMHQFF